MKIDIFPHIIPLKYKEALYKKMPTNTYVRRIIDAHPSLYDLDIRFRIMDRYEGLVQVLTLGAPPLEDIATPNDAVELAKIANDEMAELVTKYPDKFTAAVACLPMNDMDATLKEVDRAINELRFRGVQIFTDVNGRPLDSPQFIPLYEKMAYYNLPILLHPRRANTVSDYPTETESKYLVFIIFGWPYETTVAMTRLALSGVFEKYPTLKVITHHCGAMVPYFAERIRLIFTHHEMRMGFRCKEHLAKHPIDYYRMFYADTAVYGNTSALMCGYAFLGADHILFGTDMPYDAQHGDIYTRQTISAIEHMDITDYEKKKIFEDNAKNLLRLPL